jgi:hypothetical protein
MPRNDEIVVFRRRDAINRVSTTFPLLPPKQIQNLNCRFLIQVKVSFPQGPYIKGVDKNADRGMDEQNRNHFLATGEST